MLTAHRRWTRVCVALLFTSTVFGAIHAPVAAQGVHHSLPIFHYNAEDGNATWPATLDPAIATDGYSINVFDLIYASFVKLNYATYGIIPDLATHWKISKNHKTYWFYLRPNAHFSNGDSVTAQDEVWSLTRLLAKSTNSPIAMTYFNHILGAKKLNDGKTNRLQGAKALNSHVVQITLDKPIAYFLKTFAYWANKTLDPRVIAGHKPGVYLTDDCSANVGAGPFMLKCRNRSRDKSSFYPIGTTPTITLIPNPHFYGRKPHIEIVIRPYASYQTGYSAYRTNELDVAELPAADVARYRRTPQLREFPAPSITYLMPNLQVAPFNNIHCRLAVSYAIDRDTINNVVLRRTQRSIYAMVPKPIQGFYAGNDNPHYNVVLAKKELAECPGGIHGVTMTYPRISTDWDNEFSAVQNMLSQAGIGVQTKGIPVNNWLTDIVEPETRTHNTLLVGDWGMDFPDAEDFCTLLLRAGEIYNVGEYNNSRYNSLVDRADITLNQPQRTKLYIKAQHLALTSGAWIMIGQQVQDAVVKPWVHGIIAAYGNSEVAPLNDDWANVTISKH